MSDFRDASEGAWMNFAGAMAYGDYLGLDANLSAQHRGTGGTSGVAYLRKMLEGELFPELWHVRGSL